MNRGPKISVNLCCYNSERYLEETLQSIFSQTYTDWELVIVNDGSTDATERIIRKHQSDGRPIVYHYQSNAGLGKARNKALELSRGKYVALIDHDDVWMQGKLEAQVRLLESDPQLGLVYCDGYAVDAQGRDLALYSNKYYPARGYIFDELAQGCFIRPVAAVVSRSVLEKVGGFPDFRMAEEYDLFLRIAFEYPIGYIDAPLYKYRFHEQNLSLRGRDAMILETITIRQYWLDRTRREDPNRVRHMRVLAALAYAAYGSMLLEQGYPREARPYLARSLQLNPFQFRYLHFALTWISPTMATSVLGGIRHFLRKLGTQ